MSYQKDLDEYSDEELISELDRRLDQLKLQQCSYCCNKIVECTCRFKYDSKREREHCRLLQRIVSLGQIHRYSNKG